MKKKRMANRTGAGQSTLLENATSERGLNEDSHKVQDKNFKQKASQAWKVVRLSFKIESYMSI